MLVALKINKKQLLQYKTVDNPYMLFIVAVPFTQYLSLLFPDFERGRGSVSNCSLNIHAIVIILFTLFNSVVMKINV